MTKTHVSRHEREVGTPKGWKKVGTNTWYNSEVKNGFEFNTSVDVSQKPPLSRKKNWRVQIGSNRWTGIISRNNLTKIDALLFAKDWMKKNPNG